MTDRNRNIRATFIFFAAIGMLVAMSLLARAEPGVCYDFSPDGTLAKFNPHVKRVELVYHLWAMHDGRNVTKSIYWDRLLAAANKPNGIAGSNIEADKSPVPAWVRPHTTLKELNPNKDANGKPIPPPTLAEVKETHRLISVRMEPVFIAASFSGAQCWDYRTVQVNSLELWVSQPERAYAELESLVNLVSYKRGSLAKRLDASGGGVLFDCYIEDAWNKENTWMQYKPGIAIERQRAAYERLGIRAVPLLNPNTVQGNPVRPDLLNALLQASKSKGDYGWWAMPDSVTPARAKEVGAWIK